MYIADPLILCGALLLFSRLGGPNIKEPKSPDRKTVGALFVGGSLLFTVMFGMAYVIIGSQNNYYLAVSVVHFLAWVTIGLCYLDLANYHPLAFGAAFFAVLSIIICFSWDGAFWAGTITEEQYGLAPWHLMYDFEAIGGLLAVLGMAAAKTIPRVSLPTPKMTSKEKVLAVAILVATLIVIAVLMSDPAVFA